MTPHLILKLSLCGALALGGSAFGVVAAHYADKYHDQENAILNEYGYDLANAKLKNEKVFELTKELLNREISYQKFEYEKGKVEDLPKDVFMKNNAPEEDVEKFENAHNEYVASWAATGALACVSASSAVAFFATADRASNFPVL